MTMGNAFEQQTRLIHFTKQRNERGIQTSGRPKAQVSITSWAWLILISSADGSSTARMAVGFKPRPNSYGFSVYAPTFAISGQTGKYLSGCRMSKALGNNTKTNATRVH